MKRLLLTALLVMAIALALWAVSKKEAISIQEHRWLQAERKGSLNAWEKLAQLSKGEREVENRLFSEYLRMGELEKAEKLIAKWPKRDQCFAYLLLGKPLNAAAYITDDYTRHAVVATALSQPGWDGIQLAERLIPFIRSPWHRADAMNRFARTTPEPKAKWQARLHRALLAEETNVVLRKLYQEAKAENMFLIALDALTALQDQQGLYEWFKVELSKGEISRARMIADRLYGEKAEKAKMRLAAHRAKDVKDSIIKPNPESQTWDPRKIAALPNPHERIRQFRALAQEWAQRLTDSPLPEKEISAEALRSSLPLSEPFLLRSIYYANSFYINRQFMVAIEHATARGYDRQIIYLERGIATLPQLYDALQAQGLGDYLLRKGKTYILRRALLIGPKATLIIDGSEVDELRMSQQNSGIIVNVGALHITHTRLTGWDEEQQKPAYANYAERKKFCPFLASWSGSHTYLGGNIITALGYQNHKSYGISFSSGPKKMQMNVLHEPPWPDGIITDNSFDNLYYGFYSYEAKDVALVGNEYRNNIVYGIDPHDRSHHLTIAYNTAYGSHKKHGIIISREVDDSAYIGNMSFDNRGSGFMIDRDSQRTKVLANTAFGNGQDGLTIFESDCGEIIQNHFFNNARMGIRLRNSTGVTLTGNRLVANKQGGFYGYSSNLYKDPAHARRDFALDPFHQTADAFLSGNLFKRNGMGIIVENMSGLHLRQNRFVQQAPRVVEGEWFRSHPEIIGRIAELKIGEGEAECGK